MAAIGFELKKMLKERRDVSLLRGVLYSVFAIASYMLLLIFFLAVVSIVMDVRSAPYFERDLLVSIILYAFIFALIITGPLSAVISRYITDKLFDEEYDAILPGYNMGLLINTLVAFCFGAPFVLIAITTSEIDPLVILLAGVMFISLNLVFYNMTFVTAIKRYKNIALIFVVGLAIGLLLAIALYLFVSVPFIHAVLTGIATGFVLVAMVFSALIRKAFTGTNQHYKELIEYLWRYKTLFFTNLFYILGIYSASFVFWYMSELSVLVYGMFRIAPVFDTATLLGVFTNLLMLIIFVARAETRFHDRYQYFCRQLVIGTKKSADVAKVKMFRSLRHEIIFIVCAQAIVTIFIYFVLSLSASFFGLGGMVMSIYPSLAAGYFLVFAVGVVIVFLLYFDDRIGAIVVSALFFSITLITSIIAINFAVSALYGIGTFIGGFCAWTVAYFRLGKIEQSVERMIFQKGGIGEKIALSPLQ